MEALGEVVGQLITLIVVATAVLSFRDLAERLL